ncbi:hypothetical protein GCM10022293_12900 [Azospirillum formosense]
MEASASVSAAGFMLSTTGHPDVRRGGIGLLGLATSHPIDRWLIRRVLLTG